MQQGRADTGQRPGAGAGGNGRASAAADDAEGGPPWWQPASVMLLAVLVAEAGFVWSNGGLSEMGLRARHAAKQRRWDDFSWVKTSRVSADLAGRWVGTATCVEVCEGVELCGEDGGCTAELNVTAAGTGAYHDPQVAAQWGGVGGMQMVPTYDGRSGLRGDLRPPPLAVDDQTARGVDGAISVYSPDGATIEGYMVDGSGLLYELRLARVPCAGVSWCTIAQRCRREWDISQDYHTFRCACEAGYSGQTCGEDINECSSAPCRNSGACTDAVDSFRRVFSPSFLPYFAEN